MKSLNISKVKGVIKNLRLKDKQFIVEKKKD